MVKLILRHASLAIEGTLFALFYMDAKAFLPAAPVLAGPLVKYSLHLADEARELADEWDRMAGRARGRHR